MAKKPASLSATLMPVDEEAAIPPRMQVEISRKAEVGQSAKAENQKTRKPESQKEGGATVGLNFKVKPAFRKDFRLFCAEHDLSLVEALAQAFEFLKRAKAEKGT